MEDNNFESQSVFSLPFISRREISCDSSEYRSIKAACLRREYKNVDGTESEFGTIEDKGCCKLVEYIGWSFEENESNQLNWLIEELSSSSAVIILTASPGLMKGNAIYTIVDSLLQKQKIVSWGYRVAVDVKVLYC